jgi:hypothetical protein
VTFLHEEYLRNKMLNHNPKSQFQATVESQSNSAPFLIKPCYVVGAQAFAGDIELCATTSVIFVQEACSSFCQWSDPIQLYAPQFLILQLQVRLLQLVL